MTEFLNYEVTLQFKDGTDTKGVISHVDGSLITLGNKNYPNVQIKDLKVNQLPADFAKEQKKKKILNCKYFFGFAVYPFGPVFVLEFLCAFRVSLQFNRI